MLRASLSFRFLCLTPGGELALRFRLFATSAVEALLECVARLHALLAFLERSAASRLPERRAAAYEPGKSSIGARVHAKRVRRQPLEELAIVRDDETDPREAIERRGIEPSSAPVQVVRRLVEDQNVRLGEERRAHLPALAFAGGKRRVPIEIEGAEAESISKTTRGAALVGSEPDDVGREHFDLLLAKHDSAVFRRQREGARGRLELARDQAPERGLAGAVRAHDPVEPGRQMETCALEEGHAIAMRERELRSSNRLHPEHPCASGATRDGSPNSAA